jgi:hypothetical protein
MQLVFLSLPSPCNNVTLSKFVSTYFQVKAVDDDPDENGEVTYSKLIGDETVEKSFLLDPFTGKVSIKDNHLLDREVAEGAF